MKMMAFSFGDFFVGLFFWFPPSVMTLFASLRYLSTCI